VYTDALNHASIADGIRLSRATRVVYPHADAVALRRLILRREAGGAGGLRLIVTESLFSMDGDLAPLAALAGLAEECGALLVVDEAHATGLYGPGGGGLVRALGLERKVFATVHTGGKALGAAGAWVAGEAPLRDLLVNRARAFMFSTAPLPALALLLERAAAHLGTVGAERAATVRRRARRLKTLLRDAGIAAGVAGRGPAPLGTAAPAPPAAAASAPPGDAAEAAASAPIVPIVLGENERALAVAAALRDRGFDARAVRPPTVPRGTARLRITVTWGVDDDALAAFTTALAEALRAAGAQRDGGARDVAPRDAEARS
jgi:8-amino-7-oxononanoate synthase